MSLRQSSSAYAAPPPRAVPTPELPEPVAHVRVMDGPRRDAYDRATYPYDPEKKEVVFAERNATARACAYAACEADGAWSWVEEELAEATETVGQLPGFILIRLFQAVAELNQLREVDRDQAKNACAPGPAPGSGDTGSPPPTDAPSGSCLSPATPGS